MRRRLVIVAAATTSMVAIAFLVPLAFLVRSLAAERAVNFASDQARSLAPVLGTATDRDALEVAVDAVAQRSQGAVTIFLPNGRTVGDRVEVSADVERAQTGEAFTASEGSDRVVFVPIVQRDGRIAVVRIVVPRAVLRRGVTEATAVLVGVGLTLVVGAVLVADRLGRSTVRPVRRIASVAHRFGEGDLDARAPLDGPPEVVEVAASMNALAGRIRNLLDAEREAAADLSHRLRTPLTALRIDAETISDDAERERIVTDTDALERAVDSVIRDARRGQVETLPESDLAAVVRQRVAFWSVLAEDQGRTLSLAVPDETVAVAVTPDDLVAVVDALLGNVFAHTPEGTAFALEVGALPSGGGRLVVSDDGPGFDRRGVSRGVSGGGSTGLGLDIAQRTARASGGDLTLGDGGPGGRVQIDLGPPRRDLGAA